MARREGHHAQFCQYANLALDAQGEKLEEELARLRRTIFVGMTRAMRALLDDWIVQTADKGNVMEDPVEIYRDYFKQG